jgi:hypothetical protein
VARSGWPHPSGSVIPPTAQVQLTVLADMVSRGEVALEDLVTQFVVGGRNDLVETAASLRELCQIGGGDGCDLGRRQNWASAV